MSSENNFSTQQNRRVGEDSLQVLQIECLQILRHYLVLFCVAGRLIKIEMNVLMANSAAAVGSLMCCFSKSVPVGVHVDCRVR